MSNDSPDPKIEAPLALLTAPKPVGLPAIALNAEPVVDAAAGLPNVAVEPNPDDCPNAVLGAVLPNAEGAPV